MTAPFWETKTLAQMTRAEWESLCDGCAKCCLVKLENEDTGVVYYTNVVCQYLDLNRCRCTEYTRRNDLVPTCVWLQPDDVEKFHWLPATCAYRLVAEGKPLPDWHPLVSGTSRTVHRSGNSIRDKVVAEQYVHRDALEEHIVRWVD